MIFFKYSVQIGASLWSQSFSFFGFFEISYRAVAANAAFIGFFHSIPDPEFLLPKEISYEKKNIRNHAHRAEIHPYDSN